MTVKLYIEMFLCENIKILSYIRQVVIDGITYVNRYINHQF